MSGNDMTATPKPAICRWVITPVDPAFNNGADRAPAVITRVWGDDVVNLTVFGDYNSPSFKSSVRLFRDEEAMLAWLDSTLHGTGREEPPKSPLAAYWPPRV
jgi:hypothetical protein